MSDRSGSGRPGAAGRGKVAAILVTVAIVGALFWTVRAVTHRNTIQNCLDSGRRDCGQRIDAP